MTARLLFVAVLLSVASGARATPPDRWFDLIRETAANPSREAALTEQESSWDPFAESPVGAVGLRQCMPITCEDWAMRFCRDLGPEDPENPEWSLVCGIRYAEALERNNDFGSYCNNRRIAEQEYNGGAWVIWELRTAQSRNLADAQRVCGSRLDNGRRRSQASCRENYEYPERIDLRQIKYYWQLGGRLCD